MSAGAVPGKTFFDAIGHGIALWDARGGFREGNAAFRRRFGILAPGTIRGDFLAGLDGSGQLVRPPEQDTLGAAILTFTDGQVLRLDDWPHPEGGAITEFVDVTEAWKSQRALERARDLAAEADRSKSRFLRAANHDLRQPLASLKILIYSCMTADTEEELRDRLHAMDISVSIMEDLLGALLNIGQLDAGKVSARVQNFQLSTVFERLRIQFGQLAREKGLELRFVQPRATIESDRILLERILANFIGNAIRYTDVGRILVGCRRRGKHLRIQVRDTGLGIAPEHHERIFDEFFRVAEQQPAHHSLGLGLNIARRLADVLGHPITLRSELGAGSTFELEVPLGDVWHSSIGEPEINEQIGGEFSGLRCLVLEDDMMLRGALVTLLGRWGIVTMTLETFDDVPAALGALEGPPDIIITDYRLRGGVHGTDVVHEINDILELPCPAIVVTADTSPGLIADIRAQGFPVLIKPVSPPGLRVIMHNILFEPEFVPELS